MTSHSIVIKYRPFAALWRLDSDPSLRNNAVKWRGAWDKGEEGGEKVKSMEKWAGAML